MSANKGPRRKKSKKEKLVESSQGATIRVPVRMSDLHRMFDGDSFDPVIMVSGNRVVLTLEVPDEVREDHDSFMDFRNDIEKVADISGNLLEDLQCEWEKGIGGCDDDDDDDDELDDDLEVEEDDDDF